MAGASQPETGYIIHLGESQETRIDNTRIFSIPFYNLVDKDSFFDR